MTDTVPSLRAFKFDLPESAPRVRITAGLGTATQKSWNLRRPVTLIGSRRPAHIVLHDRKISSAHCVIVNTGTDVLLKDLHTNAGTLCSGSQIDLAILKDGDVITIGGVTIQAAIKVELDTSSDSDCGLKYVDPTTFPTPVTVSLLHTQQQWKLNRAVALIGRHVAAKIFLDHQRVSRRHAIIFRFMDAPAVFDVGGDAGIRVNGAHCSLAPLRGEDRIAVGPFRLLIGTNRDEALDVQSSGQSAPEDPSPAPDAGVDRGEPVAREVTATMTLGSGDGTDGPSGSTSGESGHRSLTEGITASWEQLNSWQSQLLDEATELSKQQTDLATREAELDARDAALRGHLHDVQRMEEQLADRERELNSRVSQIHVEREKLEEAQTACTAREAEITRRAAELSRREHVFAQRWSRLKGITCPNCGDAIKT